MQENECKNADAIDGGKCEEMRGVKIKQKLIAGGILVLSGLLMAAFSVQIASLVSTKHLVSGSGEGWHFEVLRPSSPRITAAWAGVVMIIGFVVCVFEIWISGVRIKFPPKKSG